GLAGEEKKKFWGDPAPGPADPPLRPAWAPRAQRRSATGFSRLRIYNHAGDELSFHREIQAHKITTRCVMSSEVETSHTAALQFDIRDSSTSLGMTNTTKTT